MLSQLSHIDKYFKSPLAKFSGFFFKYIIPDSHLTPQLSDSEVPLAPGITQYK